VGWYQKGKTSLDFTEARDSEWQWQCFFVTVRAGTAYRKIFFYKKSTGQWHQLGHVQVFTSLQTDNYASTPPLLSFLQAD